MARLHSCSASLIEALSDRWECTHTPSGFAAKPSEIADVSWLTARVPGTFAAALRDAGEWDGATPLALDDRDVWYRTQFKGGGEEALIFEGLATIAEIWLNGEPIRRTDNMFLPCELTAQTHAHNMLYLCFRSLTAWLATQRGRARWRTRIAVPATLRFARTALLGRMPGWCPAVQPVGPWRPVRRAHRLLPYAVRSVDARASVMNGDGSLAVRCFTDGALPPEGTAAVEVAGTTERLHRVSAHEFAGNIVIPGVPLWWPHTHGQPHLHPVKLRLGDANSDLGRIGFRSISVDRGSDGAGFALRINGEDVFCRGACWTTPDLVTLPTDTAHIRPQLEALRDAGANMVRVAGTMVYEANAFYDLCDELGLLVWQDAMLANFDYPATEQFAASLTAEVRHFLDRTQLNACLAVFCGGSEVLQQAAMFGLPKEKIDDELYRSRIADAVQRARPDVHYISNSPSGGELPFLPDTGVSHYYGVGAYCRPLDDARRANVRFASECLALANVPCARTLEDIGVNSTTDPKWKHGVPRDSGASWDFDDIRDHYLATLFRVDPLRLRYSDVARYLELSRAISCILIEETFNEWRRDGSSCHGGLIWQWQDVLPGAGWGLLDCFGRRKPAWYALHRASRIRQLILTDEGLNGLAVHIVNETAEPMQATLSLLCLKIGTTAVLEAERIVTIPARAALCLSSAALLPAFFDITRAYRFGPPAHDATVARLSDSVTGELIADAWHFPDIASLQPHDIGLNAELQHNADGWSLVLRATSFALFLHIDDEAFVASENWLHLAPLQERRIALQADQKSADTPRGEIRALNMDRVVRYAGRS
jgi:beta-mannosidase